MFGNTGVEFSFTSYNVNKKTQVFVINLEEEPNILYTILVRVGVFALINRK